MVNLASTLLILADNGHMDWDGDWWPVMMVGMVLFWALVILGIIWVIRETGGPHDDRKRSTVRDDPLATLDRRFAEGAISPEEYRERRALLKEHMDRD